MQTKTEGLKESVDEIMAPALLLDGCLKAVDEALICLEMTMVVQVESGQRLDSLPL